MFRSSGNLAHLLLTVALMPGLAACARPAKPAGFIQVDIDTSPTSTDPRYATDAISSRIDELVFDSLVKVDRNLNFVGDLAESIERPSATTVTFRLRRGIRFSDGAELTSRDVKFTYDSILAPDSQSAKRGGLRELAAVDAPDPFTVTMTTRDPYAPALELAMEAIVPADTPRPARATGAAPPGSGAFRMVSFARDESVVLERNPYRPAPDGAPAGILFKIVPDPTVRALELAEGVCDFTENDLEYDVLPWLRARPRVSVETSPGTTYKYLAFNFRNPQLRDVRVRRAIAYAIDRDAIVRSFLRGAGRLATGMLTPENWAYSPSVTTYSFDPERARQLLDQAGYPAAPDGTRALRFEYKTTPEGTRLAEVFQAMLRRVGIMLDIRTLEWATYYGDLQAGKFEITSLQWIGANDPNQYYLTFDSKMIPPNGNNRGYYSNPEMDRLVEAGQVTVDRDARRKIYAQVQALAAADLPYISLWWLDNVAVMNRGLSGFESYPNGSLRSLASVTLSAPGAAEPSE